MMRKLFVGAITATSVAAAISAFSLVQAQSTPVGPGADLIIFDAKIYTGNRGQPEASAVAVKDGRIFSVGSDADILGLKNAKTRMIDAHGRRMIPGIIDSHMHLVQEAGFNYTVRWDGVPTLARALEMLSEQSKRTPVGQWVKVIGGWSPFQFKENRFPTVEELNKAVPNRPMIVQYAYNRAYLNKQALETLGVGTPRFPAVPDAEFEKDSAGRPTGLVYGNSWTFVAFEGMVPQAPSDVETSSLLNVVRDLNRFGVTSVVDNGNRFGFTSSVAKVNALTRNYRLNLRMPFVVLELGKTGDGMVDAQLDAITRKVPMSPGQNSYPGLAHGYEYRGFGEVLDSDVHDHENFDRPAIVVSPEKMRALVNRDVAKLVRRRTPFRMHISYNENITPFLDALEKLNERLPLDGLKWSLEHAETISPENIARVRKLGGGISLDGKMAMHGDSFIKTHGIAEALRTPRFRALIDSGIPLAMSTDAFRASSPNPWIGVSWMVTGKSVSGTEVLGKDNRVTRAEALKLFTAGGAWWMNAESELGMIAPGRLADFALLDRDYFTVPDDEIKSVSSVLTVMDGRVVYGAKDYNALSPTAPPILPAWSPVKYFGSYFTGN